MAESEKGRVRLAEKIKLPTNRLLLLLPFMVLASLAAMAAVVFLGVVMLERLAQRAGMPPERLEELTRQVEILSEKVARLESKHESLSARVRGVSKLANELYLSRPMTELEQERAGLSRLKPSELLENGVEALNKKGGRPALFFETILNTYPDSPEAFKAMLQLGALRVRGGDFEGAVNILGKYLDHAEEKPAYDTAWANYYLGMAQNNLGRSEEAVRHYHAALENFLESDFFRATIRFNLGELYLRLGDREKAAAQFKALEKEFAGEKLAAGLLKRARQILQELEEE